MDFNSLPCKRPSENKSLEWVRLPYALPFLLCRMDFSENRMTVP